MKKLSLGALLIGTALACFACGGGGTQLLDASGDAGQVCNPILQMGCQAGERCTWVVDADTPSRIGHLGCVANGTILEGGECNVASATANNGVDTCVAGTLCIQRRCKKICDPQLVEGSAPGACPVNFACSLYEGFFESGGTATAGVCEPACDPLTQRLKVGTTNIEACGSVNPTQPSGTCIRGPGYRSFVCAPTAPDLYANTDRRAPLMAPNGAPYPNGCAPGFMPFYFEDASGSMRTMCSGMCAPVKVDSMIAGTMGNEKLNEGDPTALGKLVADAMPVPGHATCANMIKGSELTNGEDCRYLWFPLAGRNPARAIDTPYNNTLGICFSFSRFIAIDTNGDRIADAPEKSCAQLGTMPDPIYGTAEQNGCYPLPTGSTAFQWNPHRVGSYRLPNGEGLAVRHVFD